MTRLTAVVLAGSRGPKDPVALAAGAPHKAFAEVGGAPMLVRVVRALKASRAVDRLVVVTERADLVWAEPALDALEVLPAADGPSASVAAALAALGTPLLVTTADHALLRPEWIDAFLAGVNPDADVSAGVARAEAVKAAAPGVRRTFLRFADGPVSGCNLFHLATPEAARAVAFWRQVESERKRPWRMARMLGAGVLGRYLTGRLTMADALEELGRRAGVRAGVVVLPYGEAAIDVDKPADLILARRLAQPKS